MGPKRRQLTIAGALLVALALLGVGILIGRAHGTAAVAVAPTTTYATTSAGDLLKLLGPPSTSTTTTTVPYVLPPAGPTLTPGQIAQDLINDLKSQGVLGGGGASSFTEPPATALCSDGWVSHAAHHQGACSGHGGVAIWYR